MVLSDKNIRPFLLNRLMKAKVFSIREELRLIHNRAIADVVTLGKVLHCYEIKGETDSLSRIENQIIHYNQTFDKISIVVTQKNISSIQAIVPSFWGILMAAVNGDEIKFRHIRRAEKNPQCESKNILLSLWKSELASILKMEHPEVIEKHNKEKLMELITNSYSNKKFITFEASKQIAARKTPPLISAA